MNFIVLLYLSTILFEGNPQLVHNDDFFQKLQGDTDNVQSYEIQSMKSTLLGQKQTKLKPQVFVNIQHNEKLPQLSVKNNNPRNIIKYKNNKIHSLHEPIVHIDTENAIIDYESNDTIKTQKHLIEIETMIIRQSNKDTNLLDLSLNNEDNNDEILDEIITNDTRRLIGDTHNLPIPRHDFEIPHADANSLPNNQRIELKNKNDDISLLIPNDLNDEIYNKNQHIEPTFSSSLNDLNDKLEDDKCDHDDYNEISEKTDSEVSDENFRKDVPTNGVGITDFVKSRMMLFNHPRVCYACNSILDQSCWSPNRNTSVKYCRRDHHCCLTKVYQQKGKPHIIRDCGEVCSASSEVTSGEAYASCILCNSDLCNNAEGFAVQNIGFIVIVAIIVGISNGS